MKVEKPVINPTFFYGPIVSYQFNGDITKDKGKYRIRFTLSFKSGDVYKTQKSGFETLAEASKAKEVLIAELIRNEYIPFDYTVKEYFDYWLYYYMLEEKQVRYSTFQNYRNVLYNHLLPALGDKKKLRSVTIEDLSLAIQKIPYPVVKQRGAKIAKFTFDDAYRKHFISFNPSIAANQEIKKQLTKTQKRDIPYFSIDQIKQLLYLCKKEFCDMYIPLLLSVTLGTRISETIGLMYADIDFSANTIYILRQLGKDFDDEEKGEIVTKQLDPKTSHGIRSIPFPDWVADELIIHRAWYERQKKLVPNFYDEGYVCCRCDGTPYARNSFFRDFKKLLTMCSLPSIRWHDLRHIYASVLKNNSVNMKAVSTFLGHHSPNFTEEVYVHQEEVTYDCSMLEDEWENIRPLSRQELSNIPMDLPISDEDYNFFLSNDG